MDELGKLQESFEKLVRVSADSRNELAAIRIQQSNLSRRQSEQEKVQQQIEQERNEYQDKQQGIEVQLSKDNQFFQEKTLKATSGQKQKIDGVEKNTGETQKTLLQYIHFQCTANKTTHLKNKRAILMLRLKAELKMKNTLECFHITLIESKILIAI